MPLIRTLLIWLLLAVPATGPATGQSRGVEAGREAEAWAGVGILQVPGSGFCSAALIDPVTVLTAAHCVYPRDRRVLADPAGVRFNAGWRDGISAASRNAVRIVAHRDYDPEAPYDDANISADLALVTLDSPIPFDAAAAYAQMDRIRVGEPVTSVSFSGRRADVASINDSCEVQTRKGDILILSCESYGGMSGSPIFSFVNGKPRIVALISGSRHRAGGKINGIALAIRSPLRRVQLDSEAIGRLPAAGLPYWARRAGGGAPVRTPLATRKSVTVGGGLSGLTGSGSARTVVKPPTPSR